MNHIRPLALPLFHEARRGLTARHEDRWGDFGSALGELGHPAVQIPALVAFSAYSRWTEDEELHDLSEALASAYIINLAATTGLKLAANTRRPDEDVFNGKYGFP